MNPEEITPEQKGQLKTWAGQRDAILLEISSLKTEKEKLEAKNKEISESSSEIDIRLNQNLGRIEELKNRENDLIPLISKEISKLNSEKTRLETEVTNLNKIVKVLEPQKQNLETSISFLTEVFNSINERVGLLEKVVSHVTEVSDKNVSTISDLVSNVKSSLTDLIKVNNSAVEKTNTVINELPKVFLEVKRQSLVRQVINPKKI